MPLITPQPFREAVRAHRLKQIMPTQLGTAELQQLDARIRQRSMFSARTVLKDLLDQYKQDIGSLIDPKQVNRDGQMVTEGLNLAKARERAKLLLRKLGYDAGEKHGTIEDLASDARINLVLETNRQTVQGEGWWLQGQDAAVLDEWPAQELFRAENRTQERPWLTRWRLAGDQTGEPIATGWTITPDLRMIALKNHLIWERLGDSTLFPDGLGNAWPPFAFGSGMDVRDIAREEAEAIGLIRPGQTVPPQGIEDMNPVTEGGQ